MDFFRFSYQHKHVFCERQKEKSGKHEPNVLQKLYRAVKVARERCELCVYKNNTFFSRFAVRIVKKRVFS
jgi:hypothetical protein